MNVCQFNNSLQRLEAEDFNVYIEEFEFIDVAAFELEANSNCILFFTSIALMTKSLTLKTFTLVEEY